MRHHPWTDTSRDHIRAFLELRDARAQELAYNADDNEIGAYLAEAERQVYAEIEAEVVR